MNICATLYVTDRKQWRSWLSKHHKTSPEIWLIYYRKESGKPRISYNDAVEEALCYGWIDSIAKPRDKQSWYQRFSPRKPKSVLSELNKERIRRLIRAKKMTRYGLDSIKQHLTKRTSAPKKFILPKDILAVLKSDPIVWKNFQKFPAAYKMIRVGWIDGARKRPQEFKKRLRYFIKMTAANNRFGTIR
ncbi:MAG: YdeI/OmpD-associated family protein [Ignavibacteriales bacterium]|nr:YdeI/OmpD-associated family protein [Ignavibacteriales bacterium]